MVSASASFTGPQYYDRLGPIWMDSFAADLVQRLRNARGEVLEIAAATGIVTGRLRERLRPSLRLVAHRLSKAMLDYARGRPRGARTSNGASRCAELPFEDGSFGAVVCGFGLNVSRRTGSRARRGAARAAKGGMLLFERLGSHRRESLR